MVDEDYAADSTAQTVELDVAAGLPLNGDGNTGNDIITLNVGGTLFTSRRETLLKVPVLHVFPFPASANTWKKGSNSPDKLRNMDRNVVLTATAVL